MRTNYLGSLYKIPTHNSALHEVSFPRREISKAKISKSTADHLFITLNAVVVTMIFSPASTEAIKRNKIRDNTIDNEKCKRSEFTRKSGG